MSDHLLINCPHCGGRRKIGKKICSHCFGTGKRDLTDEFHQAIRNSVLWTVGFALEVLALGILIAINGGFWVILTFLGLLAVGHAMFSSLERLGERRKELNLHAIDSQHVKVKNPENSRLELSDDGELVDFDEQPDEYQQHRRN